MDLRILCTCLAFFVCVGTESTYAYFTPSGAKYSESLSETSKNVTVDEFINAAIVGNAGIIQSFINQGGNPDIEKDYKGRTALMLALKKGHTEIAKLLLEKSKNVDIQDKDGETALMYAITSDRLEYKNGRGPDPEVRFALIELLIEKSTNLNIQETEDGKTALIKVIDADEFDDDYEHRFKIVKLLLKKGIDLNIQDNKGRTALIIALKKKYVDIAKLLLPNGADPTIAEKKHGRTAWDYAKRRGYSEIVEMIEKAQR